MRKRGSEVGEAKRSWEASAGSGAGGEPEREALIESHQIPRRRQHFLQRAIRPDHIFCGRSTPSEAVGFNRKVGLQTGCAGSYSGPAAIFRLAFSASSISRHSLALFSVALASSKAPSI